MIKPLPAFKPIHRYLVCIDSDGCAIDSMEIKHRACFGPCIVAHWGLDSVKDEFLERWNVINLYSPTRGINRFKGLAIIAEEFGLPGWQDLKNWTQRADALSNDVLKLETGDALKNVLEWSYRVNQAIEALPLPQPFAGVKEALEMLRGQADIAVVSSANPVAIKTEWDEGGIIGYASVMLSQNDGTKGECIANLMQKGYDRADVLMIGDAPGDQLAAEQNGVCFYPIVPGGEIESWRLLKEHAWDDFKTGNLSASRANVFRQRLGL